MSLKNTQYYYFWNVGYLENDTQLVVNRFCFQDSEFILEN